MSPCPRCQLVSTPSGRLCTPCDEAATAEACAGFELAPVDDVMRRSAAPAWQRCKCGARLSLHPVKAAAS